MSFEKILYKLRDAWRQDIRQSLGGLPGYYWGTVVSVAPLQVFLDVQDPAEDPRQASDTVGGLRPEERVLLVLLDGSFSVVGVAGRENVSGVARFATVGARDAAFPEPEDGLICYVTGNGYYVRENGAWRTVLGDTGWQELTLQNGWVSAGANLTPQIRRVGNTVFLRGRVTGGTPTATIFNVSEQFRASAQMSWIVRQAGTTDITTLLCQPNGDFNAAGTSAIMSNASVPNLYVTYAVD